MRVRGHGTNCYRDSIVLPRRRSDPSATLCIVKEPKQSSQVFNCRWESPRTSANLFCSPAVKSQVDKAIADRDRMGGLEPADRLSRVPWWTIMPPAYPVQGPRSQKLGRDESSTPLPAAPGQTFAPLEITKLCPVESPEAGVRRNAHLGPASADGERERRARAPGLAWRHSRQSLCVAEAGRRRQGCI